MTQDVLFYRLKHPASGAVGRWVAVNESSDTICIGIAFENAEGAPCYEQYDSYEAYHAHGWAKDRGLEVETVSIPVELPA